MRTRGGFTLLELMVVLFLLSLLAALTAPSFSRTLLSARMHSSAAEVRATFAKARSLAVSGGRARFVVFDLEKGEYGLDNDAILRGFPEPLRLGGVQIGGEEAGAGEQTVRVRFYPDGTAQEAEVVVEDGDGGAVRVKVEPLTGIAEAGT